MVIAAAPASQNSHVSKTHAACEAIEAMIEVVALRNAATKNAPNTMVHLINERSARCLTTRQYGAYMEVKSKKRTEPLMPSDG